MKNSKVHTDQSGKSFLVDENGNFLRDERGQKIPPQHAKVLSKPGEFTYYDSSQGHCGLCGSLTCTGTCFK